MPFVIHLLYRIFDCGLLIYDTSNANKFILSTKDLISSGSDVGIFVLAFLAWKVWLTAWQENNSIEIYYDVRDFENENPVFIKVLGIPLKRNAELYCKCASSRADQFYSRNSKY